MPPRSFNPEMDLSKEELLQKLQQERDQHLQELIEQQQQQQQKEDALRQTIKEKDEEIEALSKLVPGSNPIKRRFLEPTKKGFVKKFPQLKQTQTCFSTVTCKVLLNWPHKLGHYQQVFPICSKIHYSLRIYQFFH